MSSSSPHRSCDSLARSFFFRAGFFQPMRFFLPFSFPFLSLGFFCCYCSCFLFFYTGVVQCDGCLFLSFSVGGSWLGYAVVPVMEALFQSRGWLPKVEAPGYSRHPTSILAMQLLKRSWRSGESTRLPPVWPSFSILEATRYVGRRVKFFSGYSSLRASLTTSSHSAFFTSPQTFRPTVCARTRAVL